MDITQKTANMSQSNAGDDYRRKDEISREEYFMGLALLTAQRSKDGRLQVGACIVNDEDKIVSLGYNGMPHDRHDLFSWNDNTKSYICHAEMNAVLNAKGADLKGCTLYLNMYPCVECSKIITQSGITTIVYLLDEKADQWVQKPKYKKAREFDAELETKGLIKIRKYKAKKTRPSIQINFI